MTSRACALLVVFSLPLLAAGGETASAVGIDASTDLLLHMDGSWSDASLYGRATTPVNGASFSASPSKFGQAGHFDGSGDGVYYNVASMTYPYTIDLWVRLDAFTSYNNIFGRSDTIQMNVRDSGSGYRLRLQYLTGADGSGEHTSVAMALDTWYHLAVVMTSKTAGTLFVNGAPETLSFGAGFGNWGFIGGATGLSFGTTDPAGGHGMNGWLDEIRVSMGVARYSGAFTPPTEPYDASSAVPEPSSLALLAAAGLAGLRARGRRRTPA